jgi:uncharacterized membrane protein YkoI
MLVYVRRSLEEVPSKSRFEIRDPKLRKRRMNTKKLAVGMAAVAALGIGGGAAVAAQQQEDPKIDRAAAEEAALGAVPGEVKETELEREGGSTVYEVEIAGKDGRLREVTVDASNGKVLGQEMEEEDGGYDDRGSDDQGSEDPE